MNAPFKMLDAPIALGHVIAQQSHIESQVVRRQYPQFRYRERVFVDTTPNPYAASVTFFQQDQVGQAKFINGKGDDIPLVDILRNKFEQGVLDAGVGYSFSFTEIGQAQMLGMNLSAEGAMAARDAFEYLVDAVAHTGNTALGIEGLFNTTGITSVAAAQTIALANPDQILATFNSNITAIWANSKGIDLPDTVVMPIAQYGDIATRRLGAGDGSMTVLDYIKAKNVYTAQTGRELTIEASHYITNNRMVIYRNVPEVVKMYMPMPLQFMPPQARGLQVDVYGMFRFAPLNIRRPGAMRYVTGL
jgi:hypothetical protein